jgi:tetratricopeptide (TPR) repeat protein
MKNKLWLYATALVLSACLHATEATDRAAQGFRDALKSVDRVLLIRGFDTDSVSETQPPLPEIKGTAVIASLGEVIEFKELDETCLCLSSPEIHFFHGNSFRFSMTLHHSCRLRCVDGPWSGDAVLTEASAARFRAWFAQRGYDGFVRGYDATQVWIKRKAEREARLLALFPETTRQLFSREETYRRDLQKKVDQLVAAFPNRQELILTCWRGLGELQQLWNDPQDRRPYETLIIAALDTTNEQDLRDALRALGEDDSRPWIGAYQHYTSNSREKETPIRKAVNDEWLARLAERTYRDGAVNGHWSIIRQLGEQSSVPAVRLLLQIARTSESTDFLNRERSSYSCASPNHALFVLARLHTDEAKPLIISALTTANTPEDKATLEVALAQFDGPKLIRPEHLNCQVFGVAETAWDTLSKAPDFSPSIEFLVFAANSGCYEARKDAESSLRKRGLCSLSKEEQVDDAFRDPRFVAAKTLPEIDRLIAELKLDKSGKPINELDGRALDRLFHRRAMLHLAEGNFEEARDDLKSSYDDPPGFADRALILQTLGRFDEAGNSLWIDFDRSNIGKPAAEYLERRAYLSFAKGDFVSAAEDFTASERVAFKVPDSRPIFRHLALILAGKPDKTGIAEYDPHPGFRIPDEELYWPETGIRLLQEKLTEAEVLRRITSSHQKDNDDLCEAHLVISVLRRTKGDTVGEKEHLLAALATKRYTSQSFSLATIRMRELETLATAKP